MKYRFISDPGHGWLEVPFVELCRLGIQNKISKFSHVNNGMVYLEEDCDAPVFINRKKELSEPFEFVDVYQDPTSIRNYPRYCS